MSIAALRRATAVIGAAFGDEGKGLMTDHHCAERRGDVIVVRFNGGAQAGHTVQLGDGSRHVFHHFGSGTLRGAGTFLSRFVVVNPLLWRKELPDLARLGVAPSLVIDPNAPMTTPYDMLINQILEERRGAGRHGSCGVGINETIVRNLDRRFATSAGDIVDLNGLRSRLLEIRGAYLPARLAAHGIDAVDERSARIAASDALVENYLDAAEHLRGECALADALTATAGHAVVFEGAQGLLLDEAHRFFPYVTRGSTGLRNVLAIAGEIGIEAIDVTYVMRAYMTRHGAGPFPTEHPALRFADATNVPNDYQGILRFGWLDLDLIAEAIAADMMLTAGSDIAVAPAIAVTCLDQIDETARYRHNGAVHECSPEDLVAAVARAIGIPVRYVGNGPTRADILAVEANRTTER